MAAGEAHWQIGSVETHIRLLKNQLSLMEDELPDASIDELVEHCVAAKVRRQTFDGYSPLQWWFGTQCARAVEEQGLGENRSSFERRLQFQTAAQTAFVLAYARKTLRMAQYARSRVLRNPTVGQLVRYFRMSKSGVGGGRDRGLGGRWFFLVLQEYLQLNSQRKWRESQVAAVVWLAHGGSLIRAAPEHLVGCSSLDTSLFEVANPDSALPGASWLRDLRNLRRTEYADLGNPPTESERLDAWQDPDGREQRQCGHLFLPSPDPDVPPTPESQLPQQLVRNPDSSSSRVSGVRFRGSSGRFLRRSDSHQSAHDESENSPRVRNEPGSSSRDGQPIRVDAPDHAVIPGDVEMQGEELEVGANDENPNFQRVPDHLSDENRHVEPQSSQSSEPRLPHPRRRITSQQFEKKRARETVNVEFSSCSLK